MLTLAWAIGGVFLLNVYALVLVVLRAPIYHVRLYRPMVWNIFLSLLPAVVLGGIIAVMLDVVIPTGSSELLYLIAIVGGIVWVLLLPNAAYLITELNFNHRDPNGPVPLWYDIVQVLALALSGVMNALVNILLVQLALALVVQANDPRPFTRIASWAFVGGTLLLVSFGMYLGRYIRVNSWDVRHPIGFLRKLVGHFRVRDNVIVAFGFCITHTVLLAVLYVIFAVPLIVGLGW